MGREIGRGRRKRKVAGERLGEGARKGKRWRDMEGEWKGAGVEGRGRKRGEER